MLILALSWLAVNRLTWATWFIYWLAMASRVQSTKKREGICGRMAYASMLIIGCILIFHHPDHNIIGGRLFESNALSVAGCGVTVLGLGMAVWARVHLGRYWSGMVTLKEGHKLIRSGPFRIVRHPIYTGLLIAIMGTTMITGTIDTMVGLLLAACSFVIKLRREETMLMREFGDGYMEFKRTVPTLIPFIY